MRTLRGGTDLSGVTLARFFSAHIWIFPAIIIATIGVHLYLVIRIGISSVPTKED
jgi:ubiquinol-cytochrome c reductase cytochrome b subunit